VVVQDFCHPDGGLGENFNRFRLARSLVLAAAEFQREVYRPGAADLRVDPADFGPIWLILSDLMDLSQAVAFDVGIWHSSAAGDTSSAIFRDAGVAQG
jgi:hypothetical protein